MKQYSTNIVEIKSCLIDLKEVLEAQNNTDWLVSVVTILNELTDDIDGSSTPENFENAKSLYKSIADGGRGFSEYNIWIDNEDERLNINLKLDSIRSKLWALFDL